MSDERMSDKLDNLEKLANLLGAKILRLEEIHKAQQLTNDFLIGALDSMKQRLLTKCPAYAEPAEPIGPPPKGFIFTSSSREHVMPKGARHVGKRNKRSR